MSMMMTRTNRLFGQSIHVHVHVHVHVRRSLSSYRGMLDMGGSGPESRNIKIPPVNANKNNKVQVICFDFHLLTKSVAEAEKDATAAAAALLLTNKSKVEEKDKYNRSMHMQTSSTSLSSQQQQQSQSVLPNVGLIQDFAKLLKVPLGRDMDTTGKVGSNKDDDLSALLGDDNSTPPQQQQQPQQQQRTDTKSGTKPSAVVVDFAHTDVRTKYADKLRSKLDGGLVGVDNAKAEKSSTTTRGGGGGGDASGHLAARNMAVKQGSTATRWMTMTGTGSMLQLLSNRSIHIVLLPKLPNNDNDNSSIEREAETLQMEQFTKQLPSVNFDLLVQREGKKVEVVLKGVMEELKIDPMHTMMVSDRDDYIVSAKDLGMVTCRVRPPNARRGNISAHYTIESIPDVQDLVNEINGISFNAVLNR